MYMLVYASIRFQLGMMPKKCNNRINFFMYRLTRSYKK